MYCGRVRKCHTYAFTKSDLHEHLRGHMSAALVHAGWRTEVVSAKTSEAPTKGDCFKTWVRFTGVPEIAVEVADP